MQEKEPDQHVNSADDLTGTDEEVLDELQKGARTKGALVDATGRHRNTIGHRLDVLAASGIIEEIHDSTALYDLVDDPREEDTEEADLRAKLQDALEAKDDAQAKADRLEGKLKDHQALLDDCQERLDQRDERSPPEDVEAVHDAAAAIERALDQLPDDAPGRMALADAQAFLNEVMDDAE